MSTVALPTIPLSGRGDQRPGYWLVLRRVLLGQVLGSLALVLGTAVLAWASLVRLNTSGLSLFAPWLIGGAWSIVASVGWGVLVVALVGSVVRSSVQRRTGATLSPGLTLLAVAIGGYGPFLLAASQQARLVLSVLVTTVLVLTLAFDGSGQPRRLPAGVELSRARLAALVAGCAVVLVAPFAVLHPLLSFANLEVGALGSNPNLSPNPSPGDNLRPGERLQLMTALKPGDFAITVTAVRLLGTDGVLHVDRSVVTLNAPPEPAFWHPRARATTLPLRVAAWQALWVSDTLTLKRCPATPVTLTAVRVSYREFGVSLTQVVPLDQNTTVAACAP